MDSFNDDTDRIPLYNLIPSREEVEYILSLYPGITIAFWNPYPAVGDSWLWLDVPGVKHRVFQISETYEPTVFETIVRRAWEASLPKIAPEQPQLGCPKCGTKKVQAHSPAGQVYCTDCYRKGRELTIMIWEGDTDQEHLSVL